MTVEVVCGAVYERCLCVMPDRHEGPHECNCDGSWQDDHEWFPGARFPRYEGARADRLKL